MRSNNILFNKKVRNQNDHWYHFFMPSYCYYSDDSLSLKEKIYMRKYRMKTTGFTTVGETNWIIRLESNSIMRVKIEELEAQFEKDFIEYELNKSNV